jgi:hypothetical protein
VQQIGADKILLRWHLVDSRGSNLDTAATSSTLSPAIAYFKVDYKTNSKQQTAAAAGHSWLTIDEQIDPKKREYILTDLSRADAYRFRITTFFVNGELNHSYQSARFKLDPNWALVLAAAVAASPTTQQSPTKEDVEVASETTSDFKLSSIHVQISQIWAISSSSLGIKWDISTQQNKNKTSDLAKKINGFYIYYRKVKRVK